MQKNKNREKVCPKTQSDIVLNSKVKDSSSKLIFADSILCAQFLNDYVEGLGDIVVNPEDLEDVSDRYVPLIAEERNSDTVQKVKIPNKTPFYFISLIEHKTKVDYNVGMQIFRYIYQIWEDYEKTMEKEHKGISKTKGFQYPPVIPIVYYEGTDEWTAPLEFKKKVAMQELFSDMIPNFAYQLVCLSSYSNEELLDKGDAISLVMLLNKIRSLEDIEQFTKISESRLSAIVDPLPEYLIKKIAQIFRVWLISMNTPEKEVEEIVSRVEEKKMARLFEGMQIDIQEERKKLHAEQDAFQAEQDAFHAEQDAFQAEQDAFQAAKDAFHAEQDAFQVKQAAFQAAKNAVCAEKKRLAEKEEKVMKAHIKTAHMAGKTEAQIVEELKEFFDLDAEVAVEKVKLFKE